MCYHYQVTTSTSQNDDKYKAFYEFPRKIDQLREEVSQHYAGVEKMEVVVKVEKAEIEKIKDKIKKMEEELVIISPFFLYIKNFDTYAFISLLHY